MQQPITETLESNYMPYAMSVIISRAIPEIDGFKPAHRKLLYTMYKMGLLSGARTKSANVVGQTMRLNPHGDQAIYETLVRLTMGNDALLHPFIDSKGNFGKQYSRDMAYAASRYTEVKLAEICTEIFGDIDKNTVDFVENYDATTTEPLLLPTKFPNILVNSNQGIAVGMASNLCSFNLSEVCKTTIEYIKNENCDIAATLLAPDFTTGGELIYNEETIRTIYRTGRGSVKVRAKYAYDKANNCVDITEIPYSTTVEAILDKIIDLIKQGKVREVADVRDETDLSGMKLTIDLKRGVDPEMLMAKLMKMTTLQDSFGCNFNILIDGTKPKVMGIAEVLKEWLRFRMSCIRRQLEHDIAKKSARLHLLQGLEKILLDIDKAIRIIRGTEVDAEVVPNLMAGFGIDELQAEFVAEIKLRNLNKEYILKHTQDIDNLLDQIAEMKAILGDEKRVRKLIITQLTEIDKKYGKPRRTAIVNDSDVAEIDLVEQIEDYQLRFFMTRDGYIKKISHVSLRGGSEHKLKESDEIIWECDSTNKSELMVFTDKCNVYKLKAYDVPDCKASQLGEFLPSLMDFSDDESVVGAVATLDFSGHVLFAFENGKMAKITLKSYATKNNRKKLANAYFDGSRLVQMLELSGDCELVAISTIKKALVFNTSAIPEKTTRASRGVNVMTMKKDSGLSRLIRREDAKFEDINYYKTKNIPAVGCFLKQSDEQTSFL
ncbi:MAG: topoisomerase IV [Clostridiales bacterium]|jgi:DNA gyrase subunit A|nr:topoisomerase IV [Clostridiales bacterium]